MRSLVFIVLLLCCCLHSFAQASDNSTSLQHSIDKDDFATKMYYYSLQKPAATLFVHFDKTVYTNNENVWFSAYMLKGTGDSAYNTLSVALLNNADSIVAVEEKFLMSNGVSYGNLLLPDSLPPGNYSLIAYTNYMINGAPEDVFVQPVTIKTVTEANFTASVKITDTIKGSADSLRVLLKGITKESRLLVGADVIYTIGKGKQVIATGKAKTNVFGEYTFIIPAARLTPANNLLQVEVKAGKDVKKLRLQLPVTDNTPVVKFYPEGGNMVEHIPCVVGYEITTASGDPLPATALLYEDDEIKDTLQTDAYGMGRFTLTTLPGRKYTFKLPGNNTSKSYTLPAALTEGPVIQIKNALANDSFAVKFMTRQSGLFQLVVHDYKQVFQVFNLQVKQPVVTELVFSLHEVPKGVVALTLLDSADRPLAERMIFAHYNRRSVVSIATDTSTYTTRQKVQVSLKLAGDTVNTRKAIVSVACVQENRLDMKKVQDIESYFYLKHDLQPAPYPYRPLNNDPLSTGYLQNILLIKGWRRYTWQDMLQVKPTDTLQTYSSLQLSGAVVKNDKMLKKPTSLAVLRATSIDVLTTDSSGKFILDNDNIILPQGKKIMLAVAGTEMSRIGYGIEIKDPYLLLNKKLAAENTLSWEEPKSPVQDTRQALLPNDERMRTLETVVITAAKRDNTLYGALKNACGDYVCQYNVFNCPNHPWGGKPPVKGAMYTVPGGGKMIYAGCSEPKQESLISFKGIYTHKEFYGSDYAVVNPTEPEYVSTIFWKHAAVVSKNQNAVLSFYTSDIAGRFKIIVQGVGDSGVVYGEQLINVKKME